MISRPKDTIHGYLDWFFKGKEGRWVIAQMPNAPIAIWAVLYVATLFMNDGTAKDITVLLRNLALLVWSYLEIIRGDSKFRRVLGAVVLIFTVIGLFKSLQIPAAQSGILYMI